MEKIIKIEFENKIYKISEEKINMLIEKLENCNPSCKTNLLNKKPHSIKEIKNLLEKFGLNDEYFLENINNI